MLSEEISTGELQCPVIGSLPDITVAREHEYVVRASGSVFQPVLRQAPEESGVWLSPAALNGSEARFVKDLIRTLCPAGELPELGKPLLWDGKEVWIRRNPDRQSHSFRLQVDDSDWFYPDFIVWIIDHEARTQTFGFVDPKGLREGVSGWSDPKVVCTVYMPHVVERELTEQGDRVEVEGVAWSYRIRGVLLSNTAFNALVGEDKFLVRDAAGNDVQPTQDDFRRGRIVFQPEGNDTGYVLEVLRSLSCDSALDELWKKAAQENVFSSPLAADAKLAPAVGAMLRKKVRGLG